MPVLLRTGVFSSPVRKIAKRRAVDGPLPTNRLGRRLLLIWLLQQTTIGSVKRCPDRRFLRRYASFKPTSPVRRLASSTWRPVDGPMASSALDAVIGEPTNWQTSDAGSVLAAGTKSR